MRACAWKYFARLMLTFQPAKLQWGKWWRRGLRWGVEGGGTPPCMTQTAWHVIASPTLPSVYREAASSIHSFLWYPITLHKHSVPRVASASCQLTSLQERRCKQGPLFPDCLKTFPPLTLLPHFALIYKSCLAFVPWLSLPADSFSCEKTISVLKKKFCKITNWTPFTYFLTYV